MEAICMVLFDIVVGMVTDSVKSPVDSMEDESSQAVVSDHVEVYSW